MAEAQFVAQTGDKDDDQDARKIIRRHVMLGRNKGQLRPRGSRQSTPIQGCTVFPLNEWRYVLTNDSSSLSQPEWLRRGSIPQRVGTEMSFHVFADTIDSPLMHDALHFCSVINEKLFLLAPFISFHAVGIAAACIDFLAFDALLLNAIVFGAQAYINQTYLQTTGHPRQHTRKAAQHYGRTLSLLRARLGNIEQSIATLDVIISSVITLATYALSNGEVFYASNHVHGLRKIVSMREYGIHSFRDNTKQMIELLRCDLCVSLATGQLPLFFADRMYEPIWESTYLTTSGVSTRSCSVIANEELAKLWNVLRSFSVTMNEAAFKAIMVPDQFLLDTIVSVMYRLLHISTMATPPDEAIRLAMISFCTSILIAWRGLRISLPWIQRQCQQNIQHLIQSNPQCLNAELLLWHLLMYTMTFSPLQADDKEMIEISLIRVAAQSGIDCWSGVKAVVTEFLWINIAYDDLAQKIMRDVLSDVI